MCMVLIVWHLAPARVYIFEKWSTIFFSNSHRENFAPLNHCFGQIELMIDAKYPQASDAQCTPMIVGS